MSLAYYVTATPTLTQTQPPPNAATVYPLTASAGKSTSVTAPATSGDPGTNGAEGTYSFQVMVEATASGMTLTTTVLRNGTVNLGSQTITPVVGANTFTITDSSGGSWVAGDTLEVQFTANNTNAHGGSQTLSLGLGGVVNSQYTQITAPFSTVAANAGSATGTVTVTGSATGHQPPTSGSATGSVSVTGSATGSRISQGSASGVVSATGSATGHTDTNGSATGSVSITGSASGTAPAVGANSGSATGSVSVTGTATGSRASVGSASGAVSVSGDAAGSSVHQGAADGSVAVSGSATGSRISEGSATGVVSATGSATGHMPVVGANSGSATGTVSVTGSATGHMPVVGAKEGSATGTVTITGSATGSRISEGSATGTVTIAGSATAQVSVYEHVVVSVAERSRQHLGATEHSRSRLAYDLARTRTASDRSRTKVPVGKPRTVTVREVSST